MKIGFEPPLELVHPRRVDGRKRNGGRRSPPGGRPRWNPRKELREAVFKAASRGIGQDLIAELAGVSESTLKRKCGDELKLGAQMVTAKIAMVAVEMALSGDHPQMTRWWLQVHAGWKRAR